MTKPGKSFIPLMLLRTALLTIALAVTSSAAISGTIAQGQEDETVIESNLDRIAQETAELRELPPLAEIDDVLVSQDELRAMMPELIAEEMTPEEAVAQSRSLAALGLIPAGTDLLDLTLRLMSEQVAGFYDPLSDEMLVLFDGNPGLTEYFYAHEVIHALQDAYLDPDDLMEDLTALNSDQTLATVALFEGDAVSGSTTYLERHPALTGALLREVGRDSPVMDAAPAAVVITLLFPYTSGAAFVDRLRAEGGWDTVDAAYGDVPASTEQILHPLKYLERDEPSLLALPDPASALGADWRVVDEDTLGELQTAVLLANFDPGEGFNGITGDVALPEAARNAAAGWDGDRFALWEDGRAGDPHLAIGLGHTARCARLQPRPRPVRQRPLERRLQWREPGRRGPRYPGCRRAHPPRRPGGFLRSSARSVPGRRRARRAPDRSCSRSRTRPRLNPRTKPVTTPTESTIVIAGIAHFALD